MDVYHKILEKYWGYPAFRPLQEDIIHSVCAGYDFRPSYLNIAEIRDLLPGVPVLALTATATPEVVNDIQERLRFKEKNVFQKSFARKNLAYIVRKTEDKLNTLVYILGKVPGTAIVYVRNRKRTKEIALMLQQAGISADFFHAGLNRDEKELRQARWKNNECRVIVSTNAFGMGIKRPDAGDVMRRKPSPWLFVPPRIAPS